jgi:hypothetical protein
MKTCLHRLFGDCNGCKEDYEVITANHRVNNYNCKKYYEINLLAIKSTQREEENRMFTLVKEEVNA